MKIKHELLNSALFTWASEEGQAHVANKLAEKYIELGGGSLPLVAGALWNNQQNVFRAESGWVYGRTPQQRKKMQMLAPAILMALPRHLSAPLVLSHSAEYRALQLAQESLKEATDAYVAATVVDVVNHYIHNTNITSIVLH